jgi:hypothetical protein
MRWKATKGICDFGVHGQGMKNQNIYQHGVVYDRSDGQENRMLRYSF